MKSMKTNIVICLILLFSITSAQNRNTKQSQFNDYEINIVEEDYQVYLYMKCKITLSCAYRFNDSPNEKVYYQLDTILNKPILFQRDSSAFQDQLNQLIVKQDERYNYALYPLQELQQEQRKFNSYKIDVSIIQNESSVLERNHFKNLYATLKIQKLKKLNEIEDYEYFQSLQDIDNTSINSLFITQEQERNLATTTTTVDYTSLLNLVKKAHAFGLLIIWGFLVDFSIICVRYFKAYKKYLRFHASIFAVANICSLIVIFIQISQRTNEIDNIDKQPSKERAHFGMGITMVIIITFQHLIGMVTKLNFENENGSQKVHYIKLVHKILGYLIYLLGKVNVIVGVDMFEKKYYVKSINEDYWWAKVLGGVYTIQVIVIASIEFLYRSEPEFLIKKKPNTKEYADLEKLNQHTAIVEKLSNHVPVQLINRQFPDILYVVHENSVYDISEIQHPGGQFILKHIKGKEISRYFNGGYACEQTTMAPYRHTLYAQNFLKQFFIGDIRNDYYNIMIPNEQQQQSQQLSLVPKNVWTLEEVRQVNELYKVFLFGNPRYKIKTTLPGVRWFGRSVVITPQLDTLNIHSRNYSIVLSYMEENYRFRIELIKYFQNKMRDDLGLSQMSQIRTFSPPEHVEIGNRIPLLIKKELRNTKNGLSKFMHLEVHKLFYMSEPIGHGLELDEHSDGEHIIFAAGTGILPFLDLFDYLLKKLMYTLIKDRFGQREAQLINPYNEKYEQTFGPDFRIKLYGAFTSKAECYGYQIISDLHTFCNEFQVNWFSAVVRFANQESDHFLPSTKSYFDAQFIDLALSQSFPTKFLICGPPEFNKNIYNILTTVRGIDEQRVQIV